MVVDLSCSAPATRQVSLLWRPLLLLGSSNAPIHLCPADGAGVPSQKKHQQKAEQLLRGQRRLYCFQPAESQHTNCTDPDEEKVAWGSGIALTSGLLI